MAQKIDPSDQIQIQDRSSTQILLKGTRRNAVQAIRAYHVADLQRAAAELDHHFLYVELGAAQTKNEILKTIGSSFLLPDHYGRNFDALYDCLTDPISESGPQKGFLVVLDSVPLTNRFDKEAREQLLDVFRDAADYWAEKGVPFRCFYSFP